MQGARYDVELLLQIEPANPAALSLLERLRSLEPSIKDPSANDVSVVMRGVNQCSLASNGSGAGVSQTQCELAAVAEQAWRMLQDDERQMQQAVKSKKPPRVPALKKSRPTANTSGSTKVAPANARFVENQCEQSTTLRRKTHDMWESLAQEEIRTVSKVLAKKKPRASEPQCEA